MIGSQNSTSVSTYSFLRNEPPLAPRLPQLPNQLVGRRFELEQLQSALSNERLISLVGLGGVGKTRLALQAAHQAAETMPTPFLHGVYFVPLEGVESPDMIAMTIAGLLPLTLQEGELVQRQLVDYLQHKQILLVLDNYEHLLPSTTLLGDICAFAPQVTLLVTTRERLGLYEEWSLDLHGLPLTQGAEQPAHHASVVSDAVHFFHQCARRVDPSYQISQTDQHHVMHICRLLNGLPLGIELAAGWVRMLSCQDIAKELSGSMEMLSTSHANVPDRHRSLRAACAYSWQLLNLNEQRTFAQLCIFEGAFTYQAAMQVTGASLELLRSLVNKSLIQVTGERNFRLHPALKEFGLHKLKQAPEMAESASNRHCDYYMQLLSEQRMRLDGPEQMAALEQIGLALENIRLAWQHALLQQRTAEVEGNAYTLVKFYEYRSRFAEGADFFARALQHVSTTATAVDIEFNRIFSKLNTFRALFLRRLGQEQEAEEIGQSSLQLARAHQDVPWQALSLMLLGYLAEGRDLEQAVALAQEWLALCQQSGDQDGQTTALLTLANQAYQSGDYAQMQQNCRQALALAQTGQNRRNEMRAHNALGVLYMDLQEHPDAERHLTSALHIAQSLGDRMYQALARFNLGVLATEQGNFALACQQCAAAATLANQIGWLRDEASALSALGFAAAQQAEFGDALKAFEQAEELLNRISDQVGRMALAYYKGYTLRMLGQHAAAATLLQQALAIARQLDDPTFQSLSLSALGLVQHRLGERAEGIALCLESVQRAADVGLPYQQVDALLHLAIIHREQAQWVEAGSVLEQAFSIARGKSPPHTICEIQTALAQVALAQGDAARGQQYAEPALTQLALDFPYGAIDPFGIYVCAVELLLQQGDARAATLFESARQHLRQQADQFEDVQMRHLFLQGAPSHQKLLQLQAFFSQSPDAVKSVGRPEPANNPLSSRETEVLLLLADNLTNQKIAEALMIELPTVKRHISNIYKKLQVSRRIEAVSRAREMGII